MTDSADSTRGPAGKEPKGTYSLLRRILLGTALSVAGGYAYSALTLPPTGVLTVNGRDYEVLLYENHTLTTLQAGKDRRVDRLLWLKYLATVRDTGLIRSETQLLASALCPLADSLSLPYIRVQALIPIGTRVTRITRTWDYWFTPLREATNCSTTPVPDPRLAPN